ncbi:NCS2 family permease [Halapricum salinum]|uniref:NCS2 family permease n=1 Tax=Halapricum salinum TaxID=1457250 RepID=A0A4D6HEE0_9EURY|nr:NCS2 family permease [Halapricum salinum]QCC51097.1 NCS2 family permease [Halapricum salinum]
MVRETLADYFGFEEHGTNLETEILAGATTFLTMSYIIVVNPSILSIAITPEGVSPDRVFQMLSVITILAAAVAMFVMAFYANRPIGLAPGMGLNAFFLTVVLSPALGISWQTALAAVFVEGILFMILTAVGLRETIINLFPEPVKYGVGAGIGLFLAIIGLQFMRISAADTTNITSLNPVLAQDPVAVVSLLGVFLTLALYARGMRGSIIIGIIATAIGGYVASALGVVPYSGQLPEPITLYQTTGGLAPGIDQITYDAAAYDITPIAGGFIEGFQQVDIVTFSFVVFTFFFVDFFDTAGTLTGLGQAAGFLDEDGEFPEMEKPLMADAVGTTAGGILGTSTVTAFIESSTGIEEGGRTGMTALVVAVLFLLTLPVVPLLAVIPDFAPYVALVVVALLMFQNVTDIQWDDVTHSIPAGLTIAIMPLTHSIANGIAAGMISYPIVKAAKGEASDVHIAQWIMAGAFVVYYVVRTNTLA